MDANLPDASICPYCACSREAHAVFCHSCGAFLASTRPVFEKMRARRRALFAFRILGGVLCAGLIFSLAFYSVLAKSPFGTSARALADMTVIACLASLWLYMGWWRWRWKGGLPCPACGETIAMRTAGDPRFAFCPDCGTRIARGEGRCNRIADRFAAEQEGDCAFCGAEVHSDDGYCHACGANVGRVLYDVESLIAGLSVSGSDLYRQVHLVRYGCFGALAYVVSLPLVLGWLAARIQPGAALLFAQLTLLVAWLAGLVWIVRAHHHWLEQSRDICPACARDVFRMTHGKRGAGYCPACGWCIRQDESEPYRG